MLRKSSLSFICVFILLHSAYSQIKNTESVKNAVEYLTVSEIDIQQIADYAIERRLAKNNHDTLAALRKESWDWGAGVLMFGLMQAYYQTNEKPLVDFIKKWFDYHVTDEGFQMNHTDEVAPAAVLADLILAGELNQDSEHYQNVLKNTYDYLTRTKPKKLKGCKDENGQRKPVQLQWRGRTWLDDLFMTAPFMIRYAQTKNDTTLYSKIGKHFLAHRDLSQCHKKNSFLMKHGNYLFKDYKLLFWLPAANVAWARGNGWYVSALADFLSKLPRQHVMHFEMVVLFKNIIAEIATQQLDSGLFPTVLDDRSSYGEVSATALFIYATALGLQHQWIQGDHFYALIRKGIRGILEHIDENGQVKETSSETGVFPVAALYQMMPRGTYP